MSKAVVNISANSRTELTAFILSTKVDGGLKPVYHYEDNRVYIVAVADLEILRELEMTKPDDIGLEITELLPPAEFYIKHIGHGKRTRSFPPRPPLPASLRPRLL